jgi:hypothetical protein
MATDVVRRFGYKDKELFHYYDAPEGKEIPVTDVLKRALVGDATVLAYHQAGHTVAVATASGVRVRKIPAWLLNAD